MGDKIINHNLQNDQETETEATESEETLSLTDFLVTQDQDQDQDQDQGNPPSLPKEDFFEFFQGQFSNFTDQNKMSHAEDIIFCGKLLPKKPPHQNQKPHRRNQQQQPSTLCRRSESMSEAKTTTTTPSQLVRNSKSLDDTKLHRNSSIMSSSELLKKSSSSSRWYVLLFGLVKVPPPEMDLRDMKVRQVRRSSSKINYASNTESKSSCDAVEVSESDNKCSWRLLGFLSCKSSASTAATTPLRYVSKV